MIKSGLIVFLSLLIVAACGLAIYFSAAGLPLPQVEEGQNFLRGKQAPAQAVPGWLLMLIAGIFILQIIPLIVATSRSYREVVGLADLREIAFLCEVPMYLGLLGSLLGVCVTQFLSGSLAAPLAYLTTISGILLFLFAKLAIWFPLSRRQSEVARVQVSA